MPPRQVWLFEFGCWAAITTAVIHVALGIAMRATDGPLNLLFAVCFAAVGAMGLVVSKRGQADAQLMYGVARSAAVATATLLVLSLSYLLHRPRHVHRRSDDVFRRVGSESAGGLGS